ncbi:hypothetical protein HNP55_001139 [Paucibacter oligotrophus]|uniref:Lipoprotein n=1 Tax=Roseateles oligotrophus TaxID=1769250 RepID=A0A840L2C8_9BURK|nr:hypothetical protein [Roseateles oligotrophus]MBB4842624.1 hypothetical protein [Roseateles oligotrophus]
MKSLANMKTTSLYPSSRAVLGCTLLLAACGGAGGGESPPPAPQRKDTVHHVRLKTTIPPLLALAEESWNFANKMCPGFMAQKPNHEVFRQWEDIYYGAGATAVHTTTHTVKGNTRANASNTAISCEVLEEKTHTIEVYTPAGHCRYDVMAGTGGLSAHGRGCGTPFDVFAPTKNKRSNSVRDTDRTLKFGVEECKVFESRSVDLDSRLKTEDCIQLRDDVFVGSYQGGVGGLQLNVVGDGRLLEAMTMEKIDRDRMLPDLHSIFPRSVADLPKP